ETTKAQADAVAEKLRELSIDGPWSQDAHIGPVRLSVGLSHIRGEDTAQDVIQHADANLYASRQQAQVAGSGR
ncbi:MAG: diguanylate cyclase, partial [Candidatus Omnitrophica bacterium]|nr:diguanylate cyclase [Candidatus Omnitrophota bacterium]